MTSRIVLSIVALTIHVAALEGQPSAATESAAPASAEAAAQRLNRIIGRQQAKHVRESFGQAAHECFTSSDLELFRERRTPMQIGLAVARLSEFHSIVKELASLPSAERGRLLAGLRRPLRPTWAELGRITRRGQTDAGNLAERLIADAIVDLVEQVLAARSP